MGGFVDITGCAFGELIVIKRGWREHRNAMWWCLCSCGVARLVSSGALISGPAVCCMVCTNERRRVVSRLNNPPRPVVVGTKVGQLTVISGPYIAEMSGIDAEEAWLCLCACGKSVYVDRAKLARTKRFTKSCGCLAKKHGRYALGVGNTHHPLANVYTGIVDRCYRGQNSSYSDYGARGIRMCDRWLSDFQAFVDDVGPRPSPQHSLDRIDNGGIYEPGNVRWADRYEQANNKTNNVFLTLHGETRSMAQWAEVLGISPVTLRGRLRRGLPLEEVLKPISDIGRRGRYKRRLTKLERTIKLCMEEDRDLTKALLKKYLV